MCTHLRRQKSSGSISTNFSQFFCVMFLQTHEQYQVHWQHSLYSTIKNVSQNISADSAKLHVLWTCVLQTATDKKILIQTLWIYHSSFMMSLRWCSDNFKYIEGMVCILWIETCTKTLEANISKLTFFKT